MFFFRPRNSSQIRLGVAMLSFRLHGAGLHALAIPCAPFRSLSSAAALAPSLHGVPVTCAQPAALAAFDAAVDAYASSQLAAVPLAQRASDADATFVAAHALAAAASVWRAGDSGGRACGAARRALAAGAACVRAGRATPREVALLLAAEARAGGRPRVAARVLDAELGARPADLLAVRLSADAWWAAGAPAGALRSVARVFQSWDPRMRGARAVAALLARALAEGGASDRAEAMAASVLSAEPRDTVGALAAVHALLARGRADEAGRFLRETEEAWGGPGGGSEFENLGAEGLLPWGGTSADESMLHSFAAGLAVETGGAGFRGALSRYDAALGPAGAQKKGGAWSDAARTLWLLELLAGGGADGVVAPRRPRGSGGGVASRWRALGEAALSQDSGERGAGLGDVLLELKDCVPLRNPSSDVLHAVVLANAAADSGANDARWRGALDAHLEEVRRAEARAARAATDAEWLRDAASAMGAPPPSLALLCTLDSPRLAAAAAARAAAEGVADFFCGAGATVNTADLLGDANDGWAALRSTGAVLHPSTAIADLVELTFIQAACSGVGGRRLQSARAAAGARVTQAPHSPLAWATLGGVLEKCGGSEGQVRAAKDRAHALGWNQGAVY
jgi:hypothetical protein